LVPRQNIVNLQLAFWLFVTYFVGLMICSFFNHLKYIKKDIEVEKFKKLILEMYQGFPGFVYFGMVEEAVKSKKTRAMLVEKGFLIREKIEGKEVYRLGPTATSLVVAWKTEDLTKWILFLTIIMIALMILQFY
jgi:hypothetical protein